MSQHIPKVNRQDVERVIEREFVSEKRSEVCQLLGFYGRESFHREVDRVHIDVLKLADGDIEKLKREIEGACCDYRDTMLAAEYPNYAKKMFRIDKLPNDERKKIIDADREQYETWLHTTKPDSEQGGAGQRR